MTYVIIKEYGRYRIKNDKYYKRYGSLTSIIYVSCSACSAKVLAYQKDGKQGSLKRCYLNRIIWLNVNTLENLGRASVLRCHGCHALLGRRLQFKDRQAFAIRPHSYKRRTIYKNWKQGVRYTP